jgi:glycosyltransferase involved in cell wall biosynthesis
MYVGAHSLYSGLDVVIDAADILEREVRALPVTFRLIGDGPEKPRLKDKARHLGLKSVTFEDPVPHSTLPDTLREADGFLMVYKDAPLLRWGLCPNKLYDYMAAGRPLLFGMRIPNNPVKILGAGVEFEPENPRALANAIQKFLKIPATERTAMGRRAREYVELHHAFPVIGERLREVLEEVVASTA